MPKLRFTNPQGKTIEVDSPDGSTPSEQELDQMFASAFPESEQGFLGKAWDKVSSGLDAVTTPVWEHVAGSQAAQARGIKPEHFPGLGAAMTAAAGATGMGRFPGMASMAASQSPLDLATLPAMASVAGVKGIAGAAVKGSRALEILGGLGLGTQGTAEAWNAIKEGNWKALPQGVVKALVGGAMATPNATRVADNALKDLDEIQAGKKVWDPQTTETLTTGVEEEALARMVDDAEAALRGSGARRANAQTVARMLGIGSKNTDPIMPILVQRGVLTPEGATGSFRINPDPRTLGRGATMEEQLSQTIGKVLESQGKEAIGKLSRKPLKPRGHEIERPAVEGKMRKKNLRRQDAATKGAWDEMMASMKKSGEPGEDPFIEGELSDWARTRAEFEFDPVASSKATKNPTATIRIGRKTISLHDPTGTVEPELGTAILQRPYVPRVLERYENIVRILQREGPGTTPVAVEGVTVFPGLRGFTATFDPRYGNNIYVGIHTIASNIQDKVLRGVIPAEKAGMYFAARLKANAIHEYAHAKNLLKGLEHGALFKFLQGENRRSAQITRGQWFNSSNAAEWNEIFNAAKDDARSLFEHMGRRKRGISQLGGQVSDGGTSGIVENELEGAISLGREGERGAVAMDLPGTLLKAGVKKGQELGKDAGDLMRASLAGDLAVAVRNVESGFRMIGKGAVGSVGASTVARLRAARESLAGNSAKAAELRRSAQRYDEVAKAFGKATLREAAATFSDALSYMTKGKIQPKFGDPAQFGEQLDVMAELGQKKLSDKLRAFSSAEVTTETGSKPAQILKKGMMFFNIMGDRFINRTFLTAHMDALQKVHGLSSPRAVQRLAEQNPKLRAEIEDYLEKAGAEAFRASWQNVSPSGTLARKVTRMLDNTPGGILVQPFAKAFLSNMLPNIVESWPVLAMGSKRVRNSFEHEALRTAWRTLKEEGGEQSLKRAAHIRAKMRKLEMDGVYDTNMIYSRMLMGPLVVAAAATRRLASGDDGTNFDETAIQVGPDGRATKVASFTSQAGEDLPAWLLGDMLGHEILSRKTGKPSKYDGPDGQVYVGQLMQGLYGSRYGYNSPLMSVIGDLISGKKKISTELLGNTAEAMMEDLGRMAGQGAWLGGVARTLTQTGSEDERTLRRGDVSTEPNLLGRMGESFKEGVQTQIPGWRSELPKSISWPKLGFAKKSDPGHSLLGGGGELPGKPISKLVSLLPGMTRREISELERFAEDHPKNVSLSAILPRRSQDTEYDEILLKHFKEGVGKKILPVLRSGKLSSLSPEEKTVWWNQLSSVRELAEKRAKVEYKKQKGQLPQQFLDERAKEKEKKLALRGARKKLR